MKKNESTALLVMDLQDSILQRLGDAASALIEKAAAAIKSAHDAGIPVIYIVIGFREDFSDVSDNNKSFSMIKQSGMVLPEVKADIKFNPAIAPQKGDVVVLKKRISAFTGSDLEVVLRSLKVEHLVLTGVATSGIVLSTIREAADKDYKLTVISDLCGDGDEEVHRVLMTKVFTRQADVITSDEWVKSIVE